MHSTLLRSTVSRQSGREQIADEAARSRKSFLLPRCRSIRRRVAALSSRLQVRYAQSKIVASPTLRMSNIPRGQCPVDDGAPP